MIDERAKITEALAGLKDFQLKTAEYVFDQMYNKHKEKMLIADEVGLGKTIVAKGIIAKAYERYLDNGGATKENPVFNIVYICSNLALAAQNIDKLNFMDNDVYLEKIITRLNYLAFKPKKDKVTFLISSLTPGTSFNESSRQGERKERAIIYRLLCGYKVFENNRNGVKWLLKGTIRDIESWESTLDTHQENSDFKIRPDLFLRFKQELMKIKVTEERFPKLCEFLKPKKGINLWSALQTVCKKINGRNAKTLKFQNEIISHLRNTLSAICIKYLNADIFILDEFQKYSDLIKDEHESDNPAIKLAREIFTIEGAKVLMLSATPFKPFTNGFDELNGEIHYKDFQTVLKFLMKEKSGEFWSDYQENRKKFFAFLRHPEDLNNFSAEVKIIKENIEKTYRETIVRTERLLVSDDSSGLMHSVLKDKTLALQENDIKDFVDFDTITMRLNKILSGRLPIPVEYIKSSPFPFSFMEGYQHKLKLSEAINADPGLKKLLQSIPDVWIDKEAIENYRPIVSAGGKAIPNAKLRLLLNETIEDGGWKYLWVPPSIQYYKFDGAFKEAHLYSKTLIFSSWKLVPKMISSILSYEAERYSVGNPASISKNENKDETRKYFIRRRAPRAQFTFRVEKDGANAQMMNLAYILPFPTLAQIFNPMQNRMKDSSSEDIIEEITKLLSKDLSDLIAKFGKTKSSDWQKWFWAAPILLEKNRKHNKLFKNWLSEGYQSAELLIDAEDDNPQGEENTGRKKHFEYAFEVYKAPNALKLPPLNEKQFQEVLHTLAKLCLASPAVTTLRSLKRYYPDDEKLLTSAFHIAEGFVTLFNKPESIAVVRLTTMDESYLNRVLQYSIDGNIQSMLDEYVYLLKSCERVASAEKVSSHISDVLSIRTSSSQVDDLDSFLLSRKDKTGKNSPKLRSHFAVDFGDPKVATATSSGRQINIRQAFNSPFRPFVLASTSIGQEGLDFHYYCKKIFHWNLPSNPIDMEQREGRIHRYQGLVIRQNVVDKYLDKARLISKNNLWESVFSLAAEEKEHAKTPCELVPYWHTETKSDIRIQRFVPLYPFSRDIEKYKNILKVLALYRLTFGQPRQEELVEALANNIEDAELKNILNELMINLSPMFFDTTDNEGNA